MRSAEREKKVISGHDAFSEAMHAILFFPMAGAWDNYQQTWGYRNTNNNSEALLRKGRGKINLSYSLMLHGSCFPNSPIIDGMVKLAGSNH